MVPEAPSSEPTTPGSDPAGERVVRPQRCARRAGANGRNAGSRCPSTHGPVDFPQDRGSTLFAPRPAASRSGCTTGKLDQEDFLVLVRRGAARSSRARSDPLRQWDFVHCPVGTAHMIARRRGRRLRRARGRRSGAPGRRRMGRLHRRRGRAPPRRRGRARDVGPPRRRTTRFPEPTSDPLRRLAARLLGRRARDASTTLARHGARGRDRRATEQRQDDAVQRAHSRRRGDHRVRVGDREAERRHGGDRRRPPPAARRARLRSEGDAGGDPRRRRPGHGAGAARQPAPGRRDPRRARRLLARRDAGGRPRDAPARAARRRSRSRRAPARARREGGEVGRRGEAGRARDARPAARAPRCREDARRLVGRAAAGARPADDEAAPHGRERAAAGSTASSRPSSPTCRRRRRPSSATARPRSTRSCGG